VRLLPKTFSRWETAIIKTPSICQQICQLFIETTPCCSPYKSIFCQNVAQKIKTSTECSSTPTPLCRWVIIMITFHLILKIWLKSSYISIYLTFKDVISFSLWMTKLKFYPYPCMFATDVVKSKGSTTVLTRTNLLNMLWSLPNPLTACKIDRLKTRWWWPLSLFYM